MANTGTEISAQSKTALQECSANHIKKLGSSLSYYIIRICGDIIYHLGIFFGTGIIQSANQIIYAILICQSCLFLEAVV